MLQIYTKYFERYGKYNITLTQPCGYMIKLACVTFSHKYLIELAI